MTESLKNLDRQTLIGRLEKLVSSERRLTAEILDYIKEVDQRRLYLELGHTSLFSYLTSGLGYSAGAAQRRIESARLMREVPEIKSEIKAGTLNLMQVAAVAQSVRLKQKEDPKTKIQAIQKQALLQEVKGCDLAATQKILARSLDLEVQSFEKKRVQQDESIRVEMTLSKKQRADLERVKELASHIHPQMSLTEVIDFLAQEYLKRKDPLRKSATSKMEVGIAESKIEGEKEVDRRGQSVKRPPISMQTRRTVFQRDSCCQWRDPRTQKICGSRYQLQLDHIQPVWANGGPTIENLQVLCGVHNRLKYQYESGVRTLGLCSRPKAPRASEA